MLMNLHKHVWTEALDMADFREEGERNGERLKALVSLAEGYEKRVKEETELTKEQLKTRYVGRVDPKKRKSSSTVVTFCHLTNFGSQISKTLGSSLLRTTLSRSHGR